LNAAVPSFDLDLPSKSQERDFEPASMRLTRHLLSHRTGFEAGLEAIADARLGHEKARVIGIGFDFLP
jgi:hypothetical protein